VSIRGKREEKNPTGGKKKWKRGKKGEEKIKTQKSSVLRKRGISKREKGKKEKKTKPHIKKKKKETDKDIKRPRKGEKSPH